MKPIFQFFTVVLLFFISISPSYGQVIFEPLNGPFGINEINDLISDNNGHLFMSRKNEIYKSSNNGDTWTKCMNGFQVSVYSAEFSLSPTGEVYLNSGNNTLFRYNESNNKWEIVAQFYTSFAMNVEGNFWATNQEPNNKMFFSNNGVDSLQEITMNIPIEGWFNSMAVFNDNHNLISVGLGNDKSIYHFNKNGLSQKVLSKYAIFLKYNPYSGTAYSCDYTDAYRSEDGGLTWALIDFIPNSNNSNENPSKIIFGNNGETWAICYNKIFFSVNDGVTWTELPNFERLADNVLLTASGSWFQANLDGTCDEANFVRSMDNGTTWVDVSTSFKKPSVYNSILQDGIDNIYAHTCNQETVQISTNDGQIWNTYKIIIDSFAISVQKIAIKGDKMLAVGKDGKLYRSLNNGDVWTIIDNNAAQITYLKIYIDQQGIFYRHTFQGFFKSSDFGITWSDVGFAYAITQDFVFCPNGDIIAADDVFSQYYSAATNLIHEIKNLPNNILDLRVYMSYCAPSGTMFIQAENYFMAEFGTYRVTSFNETWEKITDFNQYVIYQMTANSIGHLFTVLNSDIYRSIDDGISWEFYADLPTPSFYINSLTCGTDNFLYIAYSEDVIYRSSTPTSESNYIIGNSWLDLNNNCQKDLNENPLPYSKVKASGDSDYFGFVRPDGNFIVNAPEGSYQVNVVAPNPLFAVCNADASVVLDATHDSVSVDMPLRVVQFCPYLSVSLSTPFLRRCFENTYTIQYKNDGTAAAQNAYIEVTLDSLFEFIGASVPVFSQNGLVYTFQVGTLEVGQSGSFWLKTKVSCAAEIGQTHCISANIFPDAPCGTPLVNRTSTQECRENIGAFDPNDKRAFVEGKSDPSNILQNKEIEYFIRFQNTGTDTAFRVVVEDRISGLLDLSTLTPLVSSHPYTIEVRDQRTVRFIFDNIMLPDSNINEAASHGFIKFRIAQQPDLANGEVISNLADIFFDFNAAVRTNTSSMVVGITNTYAPSADYQVLAYPNPFDEVLSFEIKTNQTLVNGLKLRLFDLLGRQILTEDINGNAHHLEVSGLERGVYFYKIETASEVIGGGKLMKM
jgi:photosystem II stability/assembly factor-like uncharacterized protein